MTAVLAAAMISLGCDSASFIPAPPPPSSPSKPGFAATYRGVPDANASSIPTGQNATGKPAGRGGRIVELILASPGDTDRIYLDQVLRRELAKERIPLRLTQPDSAARSSPDDLARAIRAAAARGAAGLIVEPRDEAAVLDALYDAIGRGLAVLLLDRSVPARGGKTIPRVEYTGFAEIGRKIVDTVLEPDARPGGARPGRIVFLHHRSDDPYLERCRASLLGPCKESGRPLEILEFEGADPGIALLEKSFEADPNVDVVLGDDATGMYIGFRIHLARTQSGRSLFRLGGYTAYDYRITTFLAHMYSFGDRSVETYGMKASQAIRSLIDGNAIGDVVGVPVTSYKKPPEPTAPAKKKAFPPSDRKP
jgi:hypothetical protein